MATLLAFAATEAHALKAADNEVEKLKDCEKRLCRLVTKKAPTNGTFSCVLSKTWAGSDIDKGSKSASLSWGFGDARCSVDMKVANAAIVAAVRDNKATLQFPQHTVTCIVERNNNPTLVVAKLSPKAEFEGGHAKKVRINLQHLRATTTIKLLVNAGVGLVDNIGLLHGPLVKSMNKLIHDKCPKIAR